MGWSYAYPEDVPTFAAEPHLQNALIGPCAVGYQLQFILFGIFMQQVYEYGCELRNHSRLSKYTAGVVVVLNVVYTAVCFEEGYTQAASSDRTVVTLFNGSLAWQTLPLLNGLIAAAAEGFLTLRAGAFFLNRKAKIAFYLWQSALIILVLFGSIASLAEGVLGYYSPRGPEGIPYNTAVSIWLWASAFADCSISIALAYNLHQRIAHFNSVTDSVLRKLILIGLRTASFTAFLSVAGALMSSIYSGWDPSKVDIPIAFWVPTGALYGISLFTTLSATRQVVEKRLGASAGSPGGVGRSLRGGGGGGGVNASAGVVFSQRQRVGPGVPDGGMWSKPGLFSTPHHHHFDDHNRGDQEHDHRHTHETMRVRTLSSASTSESSRSFKVSSSVAASASAAAARGKAFISFPATAAGAGAGTGTVPRRPPLAISVTREVVRDVDSEEKAEYYDDDVYRRQQ